MNLHTTETDDPRFIELLTSLVINFATRESQKTIHVVHVDNWFGDKWLGFRGKLVGAVGYRHTDYSKKLVLPPFIPDRILNETVYELSDNYSVIRSRKAQRHFYRTSESNIDNFIRSTGLYVWYSANTAKNTQGSIMIYSIDETECLANYIMFEKKQDWTLSKILGSSHEDIKLLLSIIPSK